MSWVATTLGDVLKVRHGKSQRAVESPSGKFPILATGGRIGWSRIPIYSRPSVLIGRKGTIDRPQYQEEPFWTIDTLFYTELTNSVDPRFIYYIFQTIDWRSMNEASGVPSLSSSRIEGVRVHLPTLEEQTSIRLVLDDADDLITTLERLITKKQAIRQGMMQQLLTGRIRLPGFKEKWQVRKLGDLLGYEQPGRYLVSTTDYSDTGVPVLTAGKTFILGYTAEQEGIYERLPVIIFDDFTTASKYVDFPFKAKSSAMKMLKANPGVNLRYIFERMQLIDFNPVDHKRRWIAEFSKLKFEVPEIDEQSAIAEVIEDADTEVLVLQRRLEKARSVKQGMKQQLLTGRTRLPVEVSS